MIICLMEPTFVIIPTYLQIATLINVYIFEEQLGYNVTEEDAEFLQNVLDISSTLKNKLKLNNYITLKY